MYAPDAITAPRHSSLPGGQMLRFAFVAAGFVLLTMLVQGYGAPLALAGLLALLALSFLVVRPHVATVLAFFLLYVNVPAMLTARGVPPVVAGAFIGLLLLPLLHVVFVRGERLRTDATLGLMVAFLLAILASSMVAVDRALALEAVTDHAMEGIILYWLVINAVRSDVALRRVLWTLLGAGALLGALSLYQEVTGSYHQEFGGLAHRNFVEAEAAGEAREERRRTWDRAQGPVNEPNRYAQIMIVLLPFAIYLHRRQRRIQAEAVHARRGRHVERDHGRGRRGRAGGFGNPSDSAALLLGLLVLAGVIITLSRGAFITLLALGVALAALRWFRFRSVLVGFATLLLIVPLVTPFYSDRVQSIAGITTLLNDDPHRQQEVDGAIRGRTTVMLSAVNVFLDHPLVGVGPRQFSTYYVQRYSAELNVRYREIRSPRRAHSLYFEMAAETGVLGLGIFLGIFIGLVHALWRERRRWLGSRPEFSDLATAASLSLMAYLLTGIFLHLSYQRYLWLLVAVAGAALHILRTEQDAGVDGGGRTSMAHVEGG